MSSYLINSMFAGFIKIIPKKSSFIVGKIINYLLTLSGVSDCVSVMLNLRHNFRKNLFKTFGKTFIKIKCYKIYLTAIPVLIVFILKY